MRLRHFPLTLAIFLAACAGPASQTEPQQPAATLPGDERTQPDAAVDAHEPAREVLPPVAVWGSASGVPVPSERLDETPATDELVSRFELFHGTNAEHRLYIQVDRPLYLPGETIWVKSWDVRAADLGGAGDTTATYQLIGPRGDIVTEKKVRVSHGVATNDFSLAAAQPGGEYKVRVTLPDATMAERPVVVSHYEPPRVKKTLDFVKDSYGPGDQVMATIALEKGTGGAMVRQPITAIVQLDGSQLTRFDTTTDHRGNAVLRFTLPTEIATGDGLLTVLVADGGVTESISRALPITLRDVRVLLFPEGGDLVAGLPSRVYFEATDPFGKPAEVAGVVLDGQGRQVAEVETLRGRGRFSMVAELGASYTFALSKPVGASVNVAFPEPKADGCVLATFDDNGESLDAVVAGVRCSSPRDVIVVAAQREQLLDVARLRAAGPDVPTIAHLRAKDRAMAQAQGVVRVTVLDEEMRPLAERLVYRNRDKRLNIALQPDRNQVTPRDQVALNVLTTTPEGRPVSAEVALSVVDDTVLSFADDKEAHILTRLYLLSELRDAATIDEPNKFFDLSDRDAPRALDLLLATRGWRRFAWDVTLAPDSDGDRMVDPLDRCPQQTEDFDGFADDDGCPDPDNDSDGILDGDDKCPLVRETYNNYKDDDGCPEPDKDGDGIPDAIDKCKSKPETFNGNKDDDGCPDKDPWENKRNRRMKGAARGDGGGFAVGGMPGRAMGAGIPQVAKAAPHPERPRAAGKQPRQRPADNKEQAKKAGAKKDKAQQPQNQQDGLFVEGQAQAGGEVANKVDKNGFAIVREFPVPRHKRLEPGGVRTDFRQTIYWAPTVRTGDNGRAAVKFPVSDAITSFRVVAEGLGGGAAGRAEHVISSTLPVSLDVRLPLEMSAGDHLLLPVTLTNTREQSVDVAVVASFGDLVSLTEVTGGRNEARHNIRVPADAKESIHVPVEVTGVKGRSVVHLSADAGGFEDEYQRELVVVPRGFPRMASAAGRTSTDAKHVLDASSPVAGTMAAAVRVFPTPAASMVGGLDGMLRRPSGCFEQTSSSNYPNVMILNYLNGQDAVDAQLLLRSQALLSEGYQRLTSYESPKKGYEWFGGDPGHEALTAYGLMEFVEMKPLYDVDNKMIDRTAKWLLSRRDGMGGFERNSRALDSFGAASAEVTDAYITWALSEAGYSDIQPEMKRQKALAKSSNDAYLLALAANTLLNLPAHKEQGLAAAKRLLELQDGDGGWQSPGHSVTKSTGANLRIETSALALLALMRADADPGAIDKGMEWLGAQRGAFGEWRATQATILALKAMTYHASWSAAAQGPGKVVLTVNGVKAGEVAFAAGLSEPIVLEGFDHLLQPGANTFAMHVEGETKLGYVMALEYRTALPETSQEATVALRTQFDKKMLPVGETVRLTATLENTTDQGQPMTLARLRIPAGLTYQDWQLKELRDKKVFDFYETSAREVTVYYRALAPSEKKTIHLDLVAMFAGVTTSEPSSAYLYYTDEHKVWTDPLTIQVNR